MISDSDPSRRITEDLKNRFFKHRDVPHFSRLETLRNHFSPGERLLVAFLAGVLAVSVLVILAGVSRAVTVEVPSHGGGLTEGLIGPARFVNPLLALSGADKDLTTLVYSGLMRATPEGDLIPDLAESYALSEDGATYTFKLRDGLTFHDGSPLSSADVLFTIHHAQNPDIKSARRADWEGVSVSAPDDKTVVFTLPHAYAPFLENATLGILPKALWVDVSSEEFPFHPLNVHPIGSGPYRIADVKTNSSGSATRYELSSFDDFALGNPYLNGITFQIYSNEEERLDAFRDGRIGSLASVSPSAVAELVRKDVHIARTALPRTFGVFFNQNKNTILADAAVRKSLAAAVDRERLIHEVLKGYGAALEGPIPPNVLGIVAPATPAPFPAAPQEPQPSGGMADDARSILSRGGWTYDQAANTWKKKGADLKFTLATAEEPELAETAELLVSMWKDVGIAVELQIYPLSELNSVVIRPRNYEAVLFGEVIGRSLDLFAFWHSSQRNDPGLNLALYTNPKADTLLTRARETTSRREREKLYAELDALIKSDAPAVFLYAPEFIYLVPSTLHGVELGALTTPSERFLNVYEWYTDTERVWNMFTNKTSE